MTTAERIAALPPVPVEPKWVGDPNKLLVLQHVTSDGRAIEMQDQPVTAWWDFERRRSEALRARLALAVEALESLLHEDGGSLAHSANHPKCAAARAVIAACKEA